VKYLLDTDHCIALTKRNPAILEKLHLHPVDSGNSGHSIPEILAGVAGTRNRGQNDPGKCYDVT